MGASHPRDVLVLGTRPYAAVFVDMFECLADQVRFAGFVENMDRARAGGTIEGLPILWHEDIGPLAATHGLVCALGTTLRRDWIEASLAQGFAFPALVHPSSVVSRRTAIGAGASVDAGCVVAGYSRLSDHCRVGRRASIGHHTVVGSFSTIHPGAILSGDCQIGEQVTVGTGAVIADGVRIGDGAVIAAGAVVRKDVPARALVSGNFADVMRREFGPR